MTQSQDTVNAARLQAILDESRTREKQVSDSNKFSETEWQKLGELSDALYDFSCWREVLERDLKRRPSQDECCERFGLLVSGLKTVVSQHGYEDFYQMIADSTAPNAEHHIACDILHQLLTSSNDESRTIINQVYGQDIPVCRYVFATLVPMLHGRWLTDNANIRRLPEIATLDDLGFVGDLRPEGFSLLIGTRPDFANFCEQLRYFRPPIEVNPNGIQGFIDVLHADENGPAHNLLLLPLNELAELIAIRNKRDQERAQLDETQSTDTEASTVPISESLLNKSSNSESVNSAPLTTDVRVANWDEGAVVIAELLKKPGAKLGSLKSSQAETANQDALLRLLSVFSDGISDERIAKSIVVLQDDTLTVKKKLTKIDGLMPFPPTASAQQLGDMLGVTKQAVLSTDWWIENRKGAKAEETDRRKTRLKERADRYED